VSFPLVVLAAGLSKRYGRLKQLEPMGPNGEAIMDYNVYDAIRAGFTEVIYVVRPEILDDVTRHVDRTFGDAVGRSFVLQELGRLPSGFRAPPDRSKPWGTAHAVMCAAAEVDGPFVVCNADDLYGPAAFRQLHAFLQDPGPAEGAVIGYPLRDTLAGGGGVARGLCHIGKEGWLEHVIEVGQIRRADAWIVGIEGENTQIDLTGDEMVSMNLWALTPAMLGGVTRQFRHFLEHWGAHPGKEFFLSSAVNEHIQGYAARVRVLGSQEPWLGVTYAEDRDRFQAALGDRIVSGVYPENLSVSLKTKV
jgi:hypothetical protein